MAGRKKQSLVFATLDSFSDGLGGTVCGRVVANNSFLKALVTQEYFSEYHFFLGDAHDISQFKKNNKWIFEDKELSGRVRLFFRTDLVPRLKAGGYHVFHQSDFITSFAQLSYLRNRYSKDCLPITGVTHSMSYQRFMPSFFQMMLAGLSRCDSIVCTSSTGRRFLENAFLSLSGRFESELGAKLEFGGQISVVPLGVSLDEPVQNGVVESSRARYDARSRLGLPRDAVIILGLARFSEFSKMDILPLLHAFKSAVSRSECDDLLLYLCGSTEGSGYDQVILDFAAQLGIADKVILNKDFQEDDKALIYRAADIFTSPSDNPQETFGITVIEAMGAGLPVVVSDFDGYKDLVDDGREGFRVPTLWGDCTGFLSEVIPVAFERPYHLHLAQSISFDVDIMAERLARLVTDDSLRHRMGCEGAAKVRQRFGWDVVMGQYIELWARLNKERPDNIARQKTADPFRLDYYEAFSHYCTGGLSSSMRLDLTGFGKEVYYKRKSQPLYEDMWEIIDTGLVRQIMYFAMQNVTLGELYSLITKSYNLPCDMLEYHILWMRKHYIINVDAAKNVEGGTRY